MNGILQHTLYVLSIIQIDRGDGKMVTWSYEGHFHKWKWKYKGRCVDQSTGEVGKSHTNSRVGAIEHAFRDLVQKLVARNAL
jgi:hypothetical protein